MTALSSSEQLQLSATIKRQALIWLAVSLALSGVFIILWLYGNSIATESTPKITAIEKSVASVKAVHVSEHIDKLDDLNADVAPIEFKTVVRDMRDYPVEFKDKIFIKNNRGKWTLQVMNVSEHEIIKDYLQRRDDRDKFAYFRFTDQNNKSRYILTYDIIGSLDEAMILASEVDFELPKSIKIVPEEINRYASMIDSYERSESVLDMSRNRPRSIILKKTSHIVPVPVKKVVKKRPKVDNSYSGYGYKKPTTRSVPKSKANSSYTAPTVTQKPTYTAPAEKPSNKFISKSLGNEPTLSLGEEKPVEVMPPPAPKATIAPAVTTPKPVAKPQPKPVVNIEQSSNVKEEKKDDYNIGGNNSQPQIQPQEKQFVPNSAPN